MTTTRLPRAHEGEQVPLGLGEPARGDGRPLRLERIALAGGELRELERGGELGLDPELLAGGLLHLGRLPDEVGRRQREHEVVGNRRRLSSSSASHGSTRSARRSAAG